MHIFIFAECVNPLLSEGRSECFNNLLQFGSNFKDDFKAIVEDRWSFSEITSENIQNTPGRQQEGPPALHACRLL